MAEIYAQHAVGGVDNDLGHGDKGSTHSYIEEYETLLAPYRDRCSFMEIGLAYGKSVAVWDEYFGPACLLTGVDLSLHFDAGQFPRWRFVKADATAPSFPTKLRNRMFDVIIDDGSHQHQDQVNTRDMLFQRMSPGGLYIIEDILALEQTRHLWAGAEIRDLRSKKGRFDDVLVIYRT